MAVDISIIIPVFNEKKTVAEIIRRILCASTLSSAHLQIIVVDDGSTDGTVDIIQTFEWINDPRFIFLFHEKNIGKGAAIRTAIPHAIGTYTIIQDADLEYDPNDIGNMYAHAVDKQYSVLFGSRNLSKNNTRGAPLFYWGGRLVSMVGNMLFSQRLTDEPTCYKLIKTELLQSFPLRARTFDFCPEVTVYIAKAGITIPEIPISYAPRNVEEGKKINWKDGVQAIVTFFHLRFAGHTQYVLAAGIAVFAFFVYIVTWHALFGGYEHETANVARALVNGTYEIKRAGIGAVVLYVPFVAVMRLFSLENFAYLTMVPVFYSALSAGFLFLLLRQLYARTATAIGTTILIVIGTVVWPYTNIGMEYQAMLYTTVLLYFLLRWKNGLSTLLPAAFVMGILAVTKSYGVLFGIGYAVFIFLSLYYRKELDRLRDGRFLIQAMGIPAVIFILNILVAYVMSNKTTGAYSLAHEFQIWTWWEGIYGIFFSFGKGILFYCPLLFLVLVYFRPFAKKFPEVAGFIFSIFIALLLITAPFSYWSDETWAVRKLVPILPLIHIPLGLLLETKKNMMKKVVISAVICAAVYIQLLGAIYPYGRQLEFLRANNLDSLQSMRFIPQLSHISLHHTFFSSYLFSTERFTYRETSWFRWTEPGRADVVFHAIDTPLDFYHAPSVIWWQRNTPLKSLVFTGIVLGMILTFIFLVNNYIYCRARE